MNYKSKVVIQAIKHGVQNRFAVLELVKSDKHFRSCQLDDFGTLSLNFAIEKLNQLVMVRVGEYLVVDQDGNYSIQQAHKFEASHEEVKL